MTKELIIRKCEEKDGNDFVRLNLEFMKEALLENPYWTALKMPSEEELLEVFFEALKTPEQIQIFIGEVDGTVVGYTNTWTVFSIWSRGKGLTVDDLYIASEYRRFGYGEKIMEYLSDYAMENGYKRVQLHAEMDNVRAHSLYRKLGFSEEEILFFMKKLEV